MNKNYYPWIAIVVGLVFATVLVFAGTTSATAEYALPLLTMLFMSELGVLVTGAGAVVAARTWLAQRNNTAMLIAALACTALAIGLLSLGLALWYGNRLG